MLDVAILGLATWRLSSLFTSEVGPWNLFTHVRSVFGILHSSEGRPNVWPASFMGELLKCLWCASLWVGALVTIAYLSVGIVTVWCALPFALSAVAVIVSKQVR
jgi:uncharacterized protein DUF1360